MPAYNKSPFAAVPQKLIPGQPAYVFGSWAQDTSPTRLHVSKVQLTSNVATLTVVVNEGNVPVVGSLITVNGLVNSEFNVLNIALTGVTLDSTGAGTVTFALTHADVALTTDAGYAIVPVPEVAEALVNEASVAVGLPYTTPFTTDSIAQSVTALVSFPSLPNAATVSLQGAIQNLDSEYQTLGTVATVAGGVVTSTVTYLTFSGKFNFYRLLVSGVSGGSSPSIIGKLLI